MAKIAFFDLDKTLISANSAHVWLRQQWEAKQISLKEIIQLSIGLLRYRLGLLSSADDMQAAVLRLKGVSQQSLGAHVQAFYERHIRQLYRPGALEAIKEHQKQNHRLALLTSSPSLLANLVAAELSFQDCLSTEFEVSDQGIFTGQTRGPLCFGAGKLVKAKAHAETLGVPLSDCIFYTDSVTDLPVLEAMGLPVAVNPDWRLKRAAARRHWKIVDWGQPPQILKGR